MKSNLLKAIVGGLIVTALMVVSACLTPVPTLEMRRAQGDPAKGTATEVVETLTPGETLQLRYVGGGEQLPTQVFAPEEFEMLGQEIRGWLPSGVAALFYPLVWRPLRKALVKETAALATKTPGA